MKDLIARLEAATEGNRELGEDIYVELSFRRLIPQTPGYPLGDRRGCQFDYTTSIDAALTLVPEGWGFMLRYHITRRGMRATASALAPFMAERGDVFDQSAATPALAHCIAALKARALDTPSTRPEGAVAVPTQAS